MDIRRFVLNYYRDAAENFYIARINNPVDTLFSLVHAYYQTFYVISGSENFSTFHRNFVKIMEVSPAAYQKLHRE